MGTFSETLLPARERYQSGVAAVNAGDYSGILNMLLAYPDLAMRAVAGGAGELSGMFGQSQTQQRKLSRDVLGMLEMDLPVHAPPATRFAETATDLAPHTAIIIGVGSPKFPFKSLREAEKLEAKGFSAAIQKSNTGVWKDVDGNWRHDLPLPASEVQMKKPITDNPQRLADVTNSPILFEADRDLRGTSIRSDPQLPYGASYFNKSDEIVVSPRHVESLIAWKLNPKEPMTSGRNIVAHEMGHAVEHHSGYLPTRLTQKPSGAEFIDQLAENIAPGASTFSSLPISGLDKAEAKTILKFDTQYPGFVDRYIYLSSLPEVNARHGANTLGMDPRVVQAMPLPSQLAGVLGAVPLQGNYAGFARQLLKDVETFNKTGSWDNTVYGNLERQITHGY